MKFKLYAFTWKPKLPGKYNLNHPCTIENRYFKR